MKICKTCGKFILDDEDGELAFTVNPGIPDKEYVECESCHDDAIDRNKIIQCEACGEWFSNDVLHSRRASRFIGSPEEIVSETALRSSTAATTEKNWRRDNYAGCNLYAHREGRHSG